MKQIRRYNFIVGTNLVYSGLFETEKGFKNWLALQKAIWDKKLKICKNYGCPLKMITVSNTIKDVKWT